MCTISGVRDWCSTVVNCTDMSHRAFSSFTAHQPANVTNFAMVLDLLYNGINPISAPRIPPSLPLPLTKETPSLYKHLTNDQRVVFREVVFRDLQIQRRRSFSYTSGDIVVGTVARAEPSTEVACFANGYAS
jgi:hypothetical protein